MSIIRSQFSTNLGRFKIEPKPLDVLERKFEDVSDETAIKKLTKERKENKELMKLLDDQLLLPVDKRSPSLLKKLGYSTAITSREDAWPPVVEGVSYYNDCYFPADKGVDASKRLGLGYQTVGVLPSGDDSFNFHFPISRDNMVETDIFKVDGMNTWVYKNGQYDSEKSQYTVYCFLYDLKHDQNEDKRVNFAKENGIKDFKIRGIGILVNSYVKNDGNKANQLLFGEAANAKPDIAKVTPKILDGMLSKLDVDPGDLSDVKYSEVVEDLKLTGSLDEQIKTALPDYKVDYVEIDKQFTAKGKSRKLNVLPTNGYVFIQYIDQKNKVVDLWKYRTTYRRNGSTEMTKISQTTSVINAFNTNYLVLKDFNKAIERTAGAELIKSIFEVNEMVPPSPSDETESEDDEIEKIPKKSKK